MNIGKTGGSGGDDLRQKPQDTGIRHADKNKGVSAKDRSQPIDKEEKILGKRETGKGTSKKMKLNIEKAEYISTDGHPFLLLMINGKETLVGEIKKELLDKGYVYLASTEEDFIWEDVLPKLTVPASEDFDEIELEGLTDDPVIVQMARDFWDATNFLNGKKFKEGSIDIPKV